MICRVFLQHTAAGGYKATPFAFPDCAGVGTTRDEALANLKAVLDARLLQGEIVTIEVGEPVHAWLKGAGMFKDDPTYADFLVEIEAYRREVDEAEPHRANVSP